MLRLALAQIGDCARAFVEIQVWDVEKRESFSSSLPQFLAVTALISHRLRGRKRENEEEPENAIRRYATPPHSRQQHQRATANMSPMLDTKHNQSLTLGHMHLKARPPPRLVSLKSAISPQPRTSDRARHQPG
ncbi:hypothetical protein SKAU_G00306190 [Synaphobranchus kaupii]|uniref:Uncharacterized protein n=1 Tax=Synaphobranchus kaupii TaxID=118154 RepID=A0A9Q1EQU3_SYNKA|nr:hypothetical protein SKAU_G00306190 [Synaphobranchus kaupii]